jgi:class 3 adenylate cyclase
MGDAVMAFFNAPLAQSDHTSRAVRAASKIQQAVADYNASAASQCCLSFGIGIHVGQAVVGNIGTVQQMNYTTIGDTVNLAKRLQESAQGGQIILSQAAYEAVQDAADVEDLGPLTVKGRTAPVYTYNLVGMKGVRTLGVRRGRE